MEAYGAARPSVGEGNRMSDLFNPHELKRCIITDELELQRFKERATRHEFYDNESGSIVVCYFSSTKGILIDQIILKRESTKYRPDIF